MKSFWKKKLPSLLLALLMMVSLVPAAAAAGADVTYTVAPGGKITFDISDFSALKSFDYLEFTGYSKLDDFGKLTAYDKDGDKVTLAEKDLDALWFYYDEDNIDYDIMIEKFEKAWIDEIVELMVDVVCSKEPYIRLF